MTKILRLMMACVWIGACAGSTNPTGPTGPSASPPVVSLPPPLPPPVAPPLRVIISGHPDALEQGSQAIFYSEAFDAVGPVVFHWQFAYEDGTVPPAIISTSNSWVFHRFDALGYITIALRGQDTRMTTEDTVLLLRVQAPCPVLFPQCHVNH